MGFQTAWVFTVPAVELSCVCASRYAFYAANCVFYALRTCRERAGGELQAQAAFGACSRVRADWAARRPWFLMKMTADGGKGVFEKIQNFPPFFFLAAAAAAAATATAAATT